MWLFNTDKNIWEKQTDTLSKVDYDNLKQDLSKVKLYSKALSGSNYLSISDVDNIYEPITYKNYKSWYVDPSSSIYLVGSIPLNGEPINKTTIDDFFKYREESGFTLRNNFTPERAILELNMIEVDAATTTAIDLNEKIFTLDGVKLIEGHKVLVKDQTETIDLSFSVDPATYFLGDYYLINNNVSDSTYYYYSSTNGIYTYTNNKLVKDVFSDYLDYKNLIVYIKQGTVNFDKQFHLSRLNNGYFPVEGEPMQYLDKHSYLLRHQTDYHNLYENNYLDIIKHGTQSILIDNFTYSIPERLIYVGDFGVVLITQDGVIPKYLYNEYKYNLKCIVEVGANYWACGENGVLLKISKLDLSMTKIDLGIEYHTLTSISFIDTQRGILVGKYNTIYSTFDGGYTWNKITFNGIGNFSYNRVIYYSYTTIYISGENGVFLELNYTDFSPTKWSLTKRNISKFLSTTDEYELIEDINDMYHISFTSSWSLSYNGVAGLGISASKDCLFFGTNNGNIIVYGINNFVSEFDFLYLGFSQSLGDITSITNQKGTPNIIVSGNNTISFNINSFGSVSTTSNFIYNAGTYSVLGITYSNSLFDYNGSVLYSSSNLGVLTGYTYGVSTFAIQSSTVSPRLLLLEYDMADKLNFFDSNYNYRLPTSVTFSSSISGTTLSVIALKDNGGATGPTWLSYLVDQYKTYPINTSIISGSPISLSLTFSSGTSSVTFSNAAISVSGGGDLNALYPIVNSSTQSRYAIFTPTAPTSSASYSAYFHKYISVFNFPNGFCDVGDIIQVSSDQVTSNLMINYKFNNYYYAFTEFNKAMLNSIKNSSSGVLTLNNLNRYSSISQLINNFNSHPVSNGYYLKTNINSSSSLGGAVLAFTFKVDSPAAVGQQYLFDGGNGDAIIQITSVSGTQVTGFSWISHGSGYVASPTHVKIYLIGGGGAFLKVSIDTVSVGSSSSSTLELDPLFNNLTAYKSLETVLYTKYVSTINYNLSYTSNYNKFGYLPNYNLLNYLTGINSEINSTVFNSSKVFYSMPQYVGLPGNNAGSFTYSNIYFDSNSGTTWLKNSLMFGSGLKYEWDTLWLNTFVDVTMHTSLGNYTKTQLLIIDKYYDSVLDGYIVAFDKKVLDINNAAVSSIDIISRNTLGEISGDLKIFNEINKPYINKAYTDGSYQNFNYFENPIKTKINTDSYAKILLSDGDIKKYLTGIIYTDANNKLVLNVVNINTTKDLVINNSFNYSSQLGLNTLTRNDVSTSQLAYITFNGGTGSSQQLNPSYIGLHNINPIDDYNVYASTPYLNVTSVSDTGTLRLYKFDPFFNYNPISLIDVGIDGMYKIPLKLYETNLSKSGLSASLIKYTSNKPTFRLIDGLDINHLSKNYHWILEAEITDGIIGINNNGPIWYSGIWESGRWFEGTWYSGVWLSGDWYGGTWSSMSIKDNVTSIEVGKNNISNDYSIWYNGRWFDGTWNGGIWYNGRRYDGPWINGLWYNGIWNEGHWYNGSFMGGIWVQGVWESGVFNSSNKPAYWIDGKFNSGDFQNGMWYNGEFGQNYSVLSKFGTLASNSRNATWHAGVFASGNFYSYENISGTDSTISISEIHKYSTWRTGIFNQGNFYGGIVYNMDCQNGTWHGGIVQDIEIIGISSPSASTITLNGVFRFNIGDYVNIIGDGSTTAYTNLGNYNNPGRYRVALTSVDLTKNWTTITLDYNFASLSFSAPYNATQSYNVNTGMRLVSKFKDIDWNSGIWYNGVFEGGNFYSGIWYDGVFSGKWGI